MSLSETTVVIATYNEADNIPHIVNAILQMDDEIKLLIIDDGSDDDTEGVAKAKAGKLGAADRLTVHQRHKKLGYGTAMTEGIELAITEGSSLVLTMDADLSHDPQEIPQIVELIETSGSDCVIGSRYVGGVRVLNWSFWRLLLSVGANFYVQKILNLKLTDATSGFRCYKKDVFESFDMGKINSRGYAFLVETIYIIKRNKFSIVEHPIIYSERREGDSKMSKWIILEAIIRPWILRVKSLFR
jgi:dolichol-phosphate mannosyltransferase